MDDIKHRSTLIRLRRRVVAFREMWQPLIRGEAVLALDIEVNRGDVRHIYLLHDNKDLTDQFEREMVDIETYVQKKLKEADIKRCRTLWTPTLVRQCSVAHIKSSAAISQRNIDLREVRRLVRVTKGGEIDETSDFVVRRQSGQRYALAATALDEVGGGTRNYEMPLTRWSVIECLKFPKQRQYKIKSRKSKSSDPSEQDAWAHSRGAHLISVQGRQKLFCVEKSREVDRPDDAVF